MERDIIDFINNRFPNDNNWLSGNCYYFALILTDRFEGTIYYDLIDGHFLTEIDGKLYDWSGPRENLCPTADHLVKWKLYCKIDPAHYNRIVRDCIM